MYFPNLVNVRRVWNPRKMMQSKDIQDEIFLQDTTRNRQRDGFPFILSVEKNIAQDIAMCVVGVIS